MQSWKILSDHGNSYEELSILITAGKSLKLIALHDMLNIFFAVLILFPIRDLIEGVLF